MMNMFIPAHSDIYNTVDYRFQTHKNSDKNHCIVFNFVYFIYVFIFLFVLFIMFQHKWNFKLDIHKMFRLQRMCVRHMSIRMKYYPFQSANVYAHDVV